MTHYDYIVIGAGSAGCVVANRLTEDMKTTVSIQVAPVLRANASKLLLITTKVKNQRKNQDFALDYFLSPKAIA